MTIDIDRGIPIFEAWLADFPDREFLEHPEKENMLCAWLAAKADSAVVTEEMIDAGAFALMKDRYSIVQIDQHRLGGTVGWQRAKIEAKAVLTAALEGGR